MTISLRALREADLAQAYKWRNDPKIMRWCRQVDYISEIEHYMWFERIHDPDAKIKMYAVTHHDGKLVGVCGLTSIDLINRSAEFSLYIGPEFHRKGYGKEALRLLLDSGFSRYNLHSIYGETFERNPAAKMFIDLGMQCTGVHHAAYYREGAYVDAYVYSILEHEWRLGKSVCPVVKMTKKKKETMS